MGMPSQFYHLLRISDKSLKDLEIKGRDIAPVFGMQAFEEKAESLREMSDFTLFYFPTLPGL